MASSAHATPRGGVRIEVELIEDEAALAAILPEWSALALASNGRVCAPSWQLSWWRHLRPERARLATVAVHDGGKLVAVAPCFLTDPSARRVDCRLLGAPTFASLAPVALPGHEWDAARQVASALSATSPRPDLVAFEGIALDSAWPELLREHWPGVLRPSSLRPWTLGAPTVHLTQGDFDAWMATKSSNFRGQMRRMRRQLAHAGGRVRETAPERLEEDVGAMLRLHEARWDGRGESALTPIAERLVRLFAELGAAGPADGSLRLQVVEVDERPVSVQAFLAVGRRVEYWNGGWDERFAKLKPAMLGILAEIERSIERGDECLSLGAGMQPYKLRFADGVEPLAWGHLVVPGPRMPVTLARLAPRALETGARRLAKRGLDAEQLERLRALRARLR